MTTEENSGSGPRSGPGPGQGPDEQGGWRPVPHGGEYDAEATAFVQLPPEDAMDAPLAAPGHGYVPPQIVPLTPDPSVAGSWAQQPLDQGDTGGVRWPEPGAEHHPAVGHHPAQAVHDGYVTGQWDFGAAGAGQDTGERPADVTGQWRIPVAEGDLLDESGEYSSGLHTSPWSAGSAPATLPGGAPAPWATQPEPEPEPQPEAAEPGVEEAVPDQEAGPEPESLQEPVQEPLLEPLQEPLPEPEPEAAPLTSSNDSAEHAANSYVLRVNGADRPVTDAWIGESLLYVLRERLGLAGAKDGCSQGECGACNVQVDGRLVASCLVPAATAAGSEVRTVEGLAVDGEPSDVQRALANCGAVQCGFCIPGMAMTVHDLLEGNHAPSELETRQALCGNLCRCSGYRGVLDAVNEVVAERAASSEAAAAASEEARIPHQAPAGAGSAQAPHPNSHDGGMA